MKTSPTPTSTVTRRPSLMQLFGLRDRTNTVADPVVPKSARDSDAPPQKRNEKAKKTAKPAYDEAELVRRYGRAFVSEVALLQFMDGGSTEHNVRRVLKRRAKLDAHEERVPLLPGARDRAVS